MAFAITNCYPQGYKKNPAIQVDSGIIMMMGCITSRKLQPDG